jgi:CheY-like chemotaxis protein
MSDDRATILIAEDDEGHATLVQRHLRRASAPATAVRVRDGQELLDYLYRRGEWQERPSHSALMILLDLNMPRIGGIEVLGRLKRDAQLAHIPVFVLTTSDNAAELERCYEEGAAACFVKPVEFGSFGAMVHRLGDFVGMARLPPEAGRTERHAG